MQNPLNHDPYGGAGNIVVPGFLRGYRCWRLDASELELYPLHVNLGPWRECKLRAYCSSDPNHPAPQASCSCGIYATYESEGYSYQLPNFWSYYVGPGAHIVHGSIKAAGRIILGDSGFRAERAEVEALWGPGARRIARVYEIPWFLTRRKFLKHFPPHDVSGLLEENPDEHAIHQQQ